MKVTMQHTVELSEVPLEIDKMMRDCTIKLKIISNVATTADPMNPEKFADQIDFIRRKLFDADNQLEECATIMKGYEKATLENNKEDLKQEPVPENKDVAREMEE